MSESSSNLPKPVVTCRRHPGSITIRLPFGYWGCERDMFLKMADGLKAEAWNLSEMSPEDAEYLEQIADAIRAAVGRADDKEQEQIGNIFG